MTLSPVRARWLFPALLFLYVGLALWYSTVIPLGEASDEVPQYTYVRYLIQNRRLSSTTAEHESFQSPLYYVLAAVLTSRIQDAPNSPFRVQANADYDPEDSRSPKNLLLHSTAEAWPYRGWALAWHSVRLLSIVFGTVTIWAVFELGRVLFPSEPGVALFMAALMAFTPQFLFMSAVVNNDSAATTFSALILWQVAAALHQSRDKQPTWLRQRSVILGLLLGLGLLSKTNLLALVPVVALALLASGLHLSRDPTKQAESLPGRRAWLVASCLVLAGVSTAAVSGWLFARNLRDIGDPLAWSLMLSVSPRREGPLTLSVLKWLFEGLFRSFWLQWNAVGLDNWVYWFIGGLCVLGLLGFFLWLLRRWRVIQPATRWTWAVFLLDAAITVGALIRLTAAVLATDDARLIYSIAPIVLVVLTAGWLWWFRSRMRGLVLGGLCAGMLVLAMVTPHRYIAPIYAPAPRAGDQELAEAELLNVDWDGIRLLGYRLESNRVQPGGKIALHLYWMARQSVDSDLLSLVQLVDTKGDFLVFRDGSPSGGRDTTDRWQSGVPIASLHLLPIPDYAQAGEYRLTLGMHPSGGREWIPAVASDGSILGDALTLPVTIHIASP
jgi:hypothetical protein